VRGLGSLCSNIVEELQGAAEEDAKVEDEELDGSVSNPRDPKLLPMTFAQLNSRLARSHGPSFDNCNVFPAALGHQQLSFRTVAAKFLHSRSLAVPSTDLECARSYGCIQLFLAALLFLEMTAQQR